MKKYFLSAAILLLTSIGIMFSSFTNKKKTVAVKAWFECTVPAHPELASSYQYMIGQSPSCSGSEDVCAVYADVANPGAADIDKYPVEEAGSGTENSLEELAGNSDDFTAQTQDVRLLN